MNGKKFPGISKKQKNSGIASTIFLILPDGAMMAVAKPRNNSKDH